MGEPMTLERALDVAAVPPKYSRDEVFEAITLLADAHVAEKVRADKAEADVNLLRWQTQQAWAELAHVTQELDAAVARAERAEARWNDYETERAKGTT